MDLRCSIPNKLLPQNIIIIILYLNTNKNKMIQRSKQNVVNYVHTYVGTYFKYMNEYEKRILTLIKKRIILKLKRTVQKFLYRYFLT